MGVDDLFVAEVAASTRRLLVAVDAGELSSTPAARHWLAGAVAALERVAQAQGHVFVGSDNAT